MEDLNDILIAVHDAEMERMLYRARRRNLKRRSSRMVHRAHRYNVRARRVERANDEEPGSRGRVLASELLELVEEHESRCAHCGRELNFDGENRQGVARCVATFDHVISLSAGGRGDKDNLVPACASCNHRRERLRLKRESLRHKPPPALRRPSTPGRLRRAMRLMHAAISAVTSALGRKRPTV